MAHMTIRESAEALGVSVDTIRRRIKDNKVKAWKVEGTYGPQWVIDSNSLAEYQQVIETVPVKYHLDPEVLIHKIETTVLEATKESARLGTLEAMKEYDKENRQEMNNLREQVQELQEQNKLLINLMENNQKVSLGKRFKGLFKSNE